MNLPSYEAVKLYFSALDVSLRSNATVLTSTQTLIIKCTAVYAFSFWATACTATVAANVQLVRDFLTEGDLAHCTRLLDQWGTANGRLATVNGAVFWCTLVDANVSSASFADPRQQGHVQCCLCRRTGCHPCSASPALYLRHNKCVAVCLDCVNETERRVPLHDSPARRHCSACGVPLVVGRPVVSIGNDRVCEACQPLVYSLPR